MASGHTSLEFTSGSNKELASLECTSEELIDYPCSPCSAKGMTRQAVNYCMECQDYYCQSCTDSLHNSLPALRKHKLVDQTVPTDRCKKHSPMLIDMYCKGHDEIGCSSCMTSNHSSCRDVYSISDAISSMSLDKAIQSSMTELQQEKKLKESHLEQLEHSRQEAIKHVKDFHKKMEEKLFELKRASIKEIEALYIIKEEKLNDDIQKLNSHICDLNKALNNLTTRATKEAQMFVSLKSAEKIMKEIKYMKSFWLSSKVTVTNSIRFMIDPEMEELLCRLKSYGIIERTLYKRELKDKYGQKLIIDCKLDDEEKCCIIDCCRATLNGYLVVIDSYNKRLKLISHDGVKDYCDLPDVPRAIRLCDDMVVVAFAHTLMHAQIEKKPIRLCCDIIGMGQFALRGVCSVNSTLYTCDGSSDVNIIYADY